jgi:hypothetical protein
VIGGKVLDASALLHFATAKSVYVQAVAWAAVEDSIVLVVPAAALTVAWADIPSTGHEVLGVLLNLPVTVIDILDRTRARDVGLFLAGISSEKQLMLAHVLECARNRGWPVLTADPHSLRSLDSSVEVEELP